MAVADKAPWPSLAPCEVRTRVAAVHNVVPSFLLFVVRPRSHLRRQPHNCRVGLMWLV